MKTISTFWSTILIELFLLLLMIGTAYGQPVLRNVLTTNNPPFPNVSFSGVTAVQSLTLDALWAFNTDGSQNAFFEWTDNGTIPLILSGSAPYVSMPLGFQVASNAAAGRVLASDASGNASWASLSAIPSAGFPLSGWVVEDFNAYSVGAISTFDKGASWRQNGALLASTGYITNVALPDGETRNVLRLFRGDYVRPLPWLTNWVSLRIGIIASIQGSAVTNNFTNNSALGICVATNSPYGFTTTTGFFGLHTGAGSGVMRYSNLVSGFHFVDTVSSMQNFVFKTNTSVAALNTSGAGSTGRAFGANQHYTAWMVELSRPTTGALNPITSTNFTARSRRPSSLTSDVVPWTRITRLDNLVADMIVQNQNGNTLTMMAGNNLVATAINDSANGVHLANLDTINLFWNDPDIYIDIMAIVIFKAM